MKRLLVLLCMLVPMAGVTASAGEARPPEVRSADVTTAKGEWRFRVFLDDKEIGQHDFRLETQGRSRLLRSTADFEYKLLFVKLYEYQHENNEVWLGDCLARIESQTDANGKPFAVSGERWENSFVVQGNAGQATLPSCVMSFAYWNPEFLKKTRLLNSQNGEFLDVQVSAPVADELDIRGESRSVLRYDLVAGPLRMQLWYSQDHEWLGLESEAEGGRTLRYVLL
jgi:hypothetical protein